MQRPWSVVSTFFLCLGMLGLAGCATPPEPDPSSAIVWGYVRLVPKQDTPVAGGGYGDRRLADIKRFDYSHPRHAVVFAPDAPPVQLPPLELTIRASRSGPVLEPAIAHASSSQGISIRNETSEAHVVSVPDAGWIGRIDAGGSSLLEDVREGEITLHLLGGAERATQQSSLVWISKGISAEVDGAGRYVLEGLEPGSLELRAWHPRLPPTRAVAVDLFRGGVHRLDLEIGVDVSDLPAKEAAR